MASQPVSSDLQPLKTENYHDANFVIIDGIGGCICANCGAANGDKVGIMTILLFQWHSKNKC